jgi:hypothetical protein
LISLSGFIDVSSSVENNPKPPSERAGLCEKHFGCVDLRRGVEATLKASFGG